MLLKNEAKVAYPPKEFYKISQALMDVLHADETKEECNAYFANIEYCKELNICVDCGQGIVPDDTWKREHFKEYTISGLCKTCQIKAFGM